MHRVMAFWADWDNVCVTWLLASTTWASPPDMVGRATLSATEQAGFGCYPCDVLSIPPRFCWFRISIRLIHSVNTPCIICPPGATNTPLGSASWLSPFRRGGVCGIAVVAFSMPCPRKARYPTNHLVPGPLDRLRRVP